MTSPTGSTGNKKQRKPQKSPPGTNFVPSKTRSLRMCASDLTICKIKTSQRQYLCPNTPQICFLCFLIQIQPDLRIARIGTPCSRLFRRCLPWLSASVRRISEINERQIKCTVNEGSGLLTTDWKITNWQLKFEVRTIMSRGEYHACMYGSDLASYDSQLLDYSKRG